MTFELTSKKLGYLLGLRLNVSKDEGRIQTNQAVYINGMLERFQMTSCEPSSILIDQTTESALEGESNPSLQHRNLFNSLVFCYVASDRKFLVV